MLKYFQELIKHDPDFQFQKAAIFNIGTKELIQHGQVTLDDVQNVLDILKQIPEEFESFNHWHRVEKPLLKSPPRKLDKKYKDYLDYLPDDVCIHLLGFLDSRSIGRCSRVCKSWNEICSRNELWETLYKQKFTNQNFPKFQNVPGFWKSEFKKAKKNRKIDYQLNFGGKLFRLHKLDPEFICGAERFHFFNRQMVFTCLKIKSFLIMGCVDGNLWSFNSRIDRVARLMKKDGFV